MDDDFAITNLYYRMFTASRHVREFPVRVYLPQSIQLSYAFINDSDEASEISNIVQIFPKWFNYISNRIR